jgi:hypothetical protein
MEDVLDVSNRIVLHLTRVPDGTRVGVSRENVPPWALDNELYAIAVASMFPRVRPGSASASGQSQAKIIEVMKRARGATLDDMIEATDWLPHTTRAALTGLSKRGFAGSSCRRRSRACRNGPAAFSSTSWRCSFVVHEPEDNIAVWYDAFNKREPALAQQVVSEDWIDIPAAPGRPSGRKGSNSSSTICLERFRNRRMAIQTIDIHEFKDGKIVRTWHSEDWLTALHQLGAFEQ